MLVLSRFLIISLSSILLFEAAKVNAHSRGGDYSGYSNYRGFNYGGTYVTDYGGHFYRVGSHNAGVYYHYRYRHYYSNYYHYPYRYREFNYYRYRDPYSYRYHYYRYPYYYRGYYRYNEYW